jgi:hypothetical protein
LKVFDDFLPRAENLIFHENKYEVLRFDTFKNEKYNKIRIRYKKCSFKHSQKIKIKIEKKCKENINKFFFELENLFSSF